MQPKLKKYLKITTITLFAVTIISLLVALYFREQIITSVLKKKIDSFDKKYSAKLNIEKVEINGFATVGISNLSIIPVDRDTLFIAKKISVTPRLWPLLKGDLVVAKLELDGLDLNLIKQDSTNNWSITRRENLIMDSLQTLHKPTNYSQAVQKVWQLIWDQLPDHFDLKNSQINYRNDSLTTLLKINNSSLINGKLSADLLYQQDSTQKKWRVDGKINSNKEELSLAVNGLDSNSFRLPFRPKKDLKIWLDKLNFEVGLAKDSKSEVSFQGLTELSGFKLSYQPLANEPITFNHKSAYQVKIGSNYFEIDSTTTTSLNNLSFRPYIYCAKDSAWSFQFKVCKSRFEAKDFFTSLPQGLFSDVRTVKADGFLNFSFDFAYNTKRPDSLVLTADLVKENFKLRHTGALNIGAVNGEFNYAVYENGEKVRDLVVGSSNGYYYPLDDVSKYLVDAVILSEDISFFWHRGINAEAFKNATITNLKRKKFAKGGSTITMQLVKNLFLTRKKTVARKVEELLIVWLIENNYLISKKRQLEIYFNVIEWGPGIYGIGEAAEFYFRKKPSNLTLEEAIYLASIIPRPKKFYTSFEADGTLKKWTGRYLNTIAAKMVNREQITEEALTSIIPYVELSGRAKSYLQNSSTDSTTTEDGILFEELIGE